MPINEPGMKWVLSGDLGTEGVGGWELGPGKAEEWWKTRRRTREARKGGREPHARVQEGVGREGDRLAFGFVKCF